MSKTWLCFLLLTLLAMRGIAQNGSNSLCAKAFERLKMHYNAQQFDSVHALLDTNFKKNMRQKDFIAFVADVHKKYGNITATTLLSSGQADVHRAFYDRDSTGATITVACDGLGKIKYLLFTPGKPGATSKTPVQIVDSLGKRYISRVNTVGLATALIMDDSVYTFYYGETVKGKAVRPDEHSLFELGSITKTFTATLAAYLVNEKKLKLTDPITRYLPDSVAKNKQLGSITMEMLLTHTSGIPSLPDNLEQHATDSLNPYKDYTKQHFFSYLKRYKTDTIPGKKFGYSNAGVALAALILERISGLPYDQMVEKYICKPLGMTETAQFLSTDQQTRFAQVYDETGDPTTPWDFKAFSGAGALRSSLSDMVKYLKANLNPPDNKTGKAIAFTHQLFARNVEVSGLGWFYTHQREQGEVQVYWHNGGTYGSHCFAAFSKLKKIAVIALSNAAEDVDYVGAEALDRIIFR